jgi:hypothetical protein
MTRVIEFAGRRNSAEKPLLNTICLCLGLYLYKLRRLHLRLVRCTVRAEILHACACISESTDNSVCSIVFDDC